MIETQLTLDGQTHSRGTSTKARRQHQGNLFAGSEILGAKALRGQPIGPIGGGDLVLKIQDTRPAPRLDIQTPVCTHHLGRCQALDCHAPASYRRTWTCNPKTGAEYGPKHYRTVCLCQRHADLFTPKQMFTTATSAGERKPQ